MSENDSNVATVIMSNDDIKIVPCPWCSIQTGISLNDINCAIFRCGLYKCVNKCSKNIDCVCQKPGDPLDPHLSKAECDAAYNENRIDGCGKPFIFDGTSTKQCDYI